MRLPGYFLPGMIVDVRAISLATQQSIRTFFFLFVVYDFSFQTPSSTLFSLSHTLRTPHFFHKLSTPLRTIRNFSHRLFTTSHRHTFSFVKQLTFSRDHITFINLRQSAWPPPDIYLCSLYNALSNVFEPS